MVKQVIAKFTVEKNSTVVNIFHADQGEGLAKHEHTFSHLTMCHAGSLVVRKEGKQLIMNKDSQPINLIKNEWHEIEALENGTVFVNIY